MNPESLWKSFCKEKNIDSSAPHEAWAFGGAPDKLAELVLRGIKTATASGYDLYFVEGETEPLPAVGDYSVILNSAGEAVCVIQTTSISIVPFNEVGSDHAFKEGEGDRSLTYWRKVHEEFFAEEYAKANMEFSLRSRIVCEEFVLVYAIPNMKRIPITYETGGKT